MKPPPPRDPPLIHPALAYALSLHPPDPLTPSSTPRRDGTPTLTTGPKPLRPLDAPPCAWNEGTLTPSTSLAASVPFPTPARGQGASRGGAPAPLPSPIEGVTKARRSRGRPGEPRGPTKRTTGPRLTHGEGCETIRSLLGWLVGHSGGTLRMRPEAEW